MKRHRFDPYTFVFGVSFAALGASFLDTELDVGDMAGAGWLPLPAVVLGILLLAVGLDRARPPAEPPGAQAPDESPPEEQAP